MSTLAVVLIVVGALLLSLALGGAIAQRRRMRAGAAEFGEVIARANRDLAAAHAADNGWEPARVEAAARRAFEERNPGRAIEEIHLVQVIDPPGTEDDEAVFRVASAGETHEVRLGRRGDDWIAADAAGQA